MYDLVHHVRGTRIGRTKRVPKLIERSQSSRHLLATSECTRLTIRPTGTGLGTRGQWLLNEIYLSKYLDEAVEDQRILNDSLRKQRWHLSHKRRLSTGGTTKNGTVFIP